MDQQVGHTEDRVVRVLADRDLHDRAVLLGHDAVQRQRRGRPLVFLDAAVVMRLEIGQLAVLIEGVRLEIEARGVDVRGADVRAVVERLGADDGEDHALAAVVAVDAVAGLEAHAGSEGDEAGLLGLGDRPVDGLAFNFTGRNKVHIVADVRLHRGAVSLGDTVVAVLRVGKQHFAQRFVFCFFHRVNSFQKFGAFCVKFGD